MGKLIDSFHEKQKSAWNGLFEKNRLYLAIVIFVCERISQCTSILKDEEFCMDLCIVAMSRYFKSRTPCT